MKILTTKDFEEIFEKNLSKYVSEKISNYNFQYAEISDQEHIDALKIIVDALINPNLPKSGEHRLEIWEKGWGENFKKFSEIQTIESINPLYFGKFPLIRYNQRFIKALSQNFEANSLSIIQDWLFDKYVKGYDNIYEFGCGTGHNLFRAREVNSTATLWGLDWATSSQKIINEIREKGIADNIYSHRFDYFNPDFDFKLKENSVVYTVASLEQIGNRHSSFLEYLLQNKPDICIHIEPIGELLDPNVFLDYLSLKYFEKRNYLNQYLEALRQLEFQGKIEIIEAKRSFIGSLFIDGYSIIIWKPIKQ
jgi:hypothetical protein